MIMRGIRFYCISFVLCSQLVACSSIAGDWTQQHAEPVPVQALPQTAEEYLQLAAAAAAPQQQQYQLNAARRLLQDSQLSRANEILGTVHTERTTLPLELEKAVLQAKVALADHKPQQAARLLQQYRATQSNAGLRNEYLDTFAKAQAETNEIVDSIRLRNTLNPLLPADANRRANQYAIWEGVQNLPAEELTELIDSPIPPDVRGWLQLALITQQASTDPEQATSALNTWRTDYPNHPGIAMLPTIKTTTTVTPTGQPKKIYLLLPLHGKFGASGQAVHDGFMAAHQINKNNQKTLPSISVIDTSLIAANTAYEQAIANNADMVVGPLEKNEIQSLVKSNHLSVPTLALNNISDTAIANLYQFGLSQLDEASQVATRASKDGRHRA
ncbi:MAG: penicillin-binding protein activator, partial [Pseudomonadota bacterium]|nr:penicillin-binding protein activator [Pseudomonadota bacterium]